MAQCISFSKAVSSPRGGGREGATRPYAPTPDAYRAGKEVELLPGFETATATDELLVEIQAGSGVLSNDYPGGQGSNDMYGYYRYGFNGQEKSDEIKGSGNSYTAEFWEYDPRIGRRWNVDPVVKDNESPYMTLANNPIVMIDPNGADWYKNKNTGGFNWFEGNGRQKGYKHMKTGTWSSRNANNISYYFGNSKDGLIMDGGNPLPEVVVTAKGKARNTLADRAFGWANYNRAEVEKWKNNLWDYHSLRSQGVSAEDAGAKFQGLGTTYERYYQAEQDYRKMSFAAVGILASPLILETGIVAGTDLFLLKMGLDGLGQTVVNGGDISKLDIWDMTLAGFSAPGASAFYGGTVDIRLDGEVKLVGYNKSWQTATLDGAFKFAFGTKGLGSAPGNMLRKVTFSTPLSELESEVVLKMLSVPFNISGKGLRNALKQNTVL